MEKPDYIIRIATYTFACPVCGSKVRPGQNYMDHDGIATCVCMMPKRKLRPLSVNQN